MNEIKKIALFEGKEIRKVWHKEKWHFVVEDVVLALIDSNDAKQYIKRMKERDDELRKGWVQIVPTLDIPTKGGKQKMNCSDLEGIFRIIQSIPSPKAEPIKLWLARVGTERLEEIQDPELAMDRVKAIYERKGYPKEWIDKRMLKSLYKKQKNLYSNIFHSINFHLFMAQSLKANFLPVQM